MALRLDPGKDGPAVRPYPGNGMMKNGRVVGVILFFSLNTLGLAEKPRENDSDTENFHLALPGYAYAFPRDHAAHPEFRTEWWYFTGHLAERDHPEAAFGYELTFFRHAVASKPVSPGSAWSLRDIHFAHFAITDLKKRTFWFSEKISRGALGLAGADTQRLHTWIEDWSLEAQPDGSWRLKARDDEHQLKLDLSPMKAPVIHGVKGVSQKAEERGRATHYVSFTRMQTHGMLRLGARESPVAGESWFDHEFGSNQLSKDQVGWDWFSLQLDGGEELMIYLLRKENGCFEKCSSGTWIGKDGSVTHLDITELSVLSRLTWKSSKTGTTYPSTWEIRIPKFKVNVTVEPLLANQELVVRESANTVYWEGACRVRGSHGGKAYVELTGYQAHP